LPVALPLKTLEDLSKIPDPEDWAAYVRQKIGNNMPILTLNNVFCAVYIGSEVLAQVKTPGGVVLPLVKTQDAVKEDIWQSKMNLVLAAGPAAFVDDASMSFYGQQIRAGDWVSFPIHTCTQLEIKTVPCRIVQDRFITSFWKDPRHLTS
jgi:hypothetical protein